MKSNVIMMNILHLNSIPLNGWAGVHWYSASGGGGIVPNPPIEPSDAIIFRAKDGDFYASDGAFYVKQ